MPTEQPDDRARELVVQRSARLDAVVHAACPALSRRVVRRLIDDGVVRVDGRVVGRGTRLEAGARVTLPLVTLEPEPDLPVDVVFADERVVIVDKPGGMPGHALDPRQRGTVAAFLAARFPDTTRVGDPLSSGLAHRLDTGTSGLLVAARTPAVHARLRAAFRAGDVAKRYLALVAGSPPAHTVVDTPLAHDPRDRRRMIAAAIGLRAWPARTEIARLRAGNGCALVAATLRTGVTHQVRVHLALVGCPVLGDALYGGPSAGLPATRHALHASALVPDRRVTYLPACERELPADLAPLVPG
jgi:23S rRNA pseudouridine1911/1915/1917 synthase